MDTGDSRILSGKREAEITTSCPSDEAGMKSIARSAPALLAVSSWVSYPTELNINTTGVLSTVNLKTPFSLVKVPEELPFTTTDTEGTGSLVILLRTVPEMATVCAKPAIAKTFTTSKASIKRQFFLIYGNFNLE